MKKGEFVKHPLRPGWGIGEVLDIVGNKATMRFVHVGVKVLDITVVSLDKVDNIKDAASVPVSIDVERRRSCAKSSTRTRYITGEVPMTVKLHFWSWPM
jgi:hypothetical protein